MKIENLKVVSATYELYLADENGQEEMYEKTTEEAPLVWCQGEGMMLPAFEKAMKAKQWATVSISLFRLQMRMVHTKRKD